ncbi:MAG TPA: hypothetical protein VMZ74_00890 [Ramlibacter sp.]|nr:hypothetical protein [Ramlibacter sp.]
MTGRLAFAAACAAVLLAGCATQGREIVAESTKALAGAPVCCGTLATAKRTALPTQRTDVAIDASAQAFDFGGNKAFFVMYELPAFKATYSVVLTSLAGGTIQDTALFIPRVATYDADFKVVRFFDEKSLRNRGNNLERTVFFNPQDRGERYIAVYGSDLSASIERAYSEVTVTPVFAGPVMFNVYGGRDGKSTLRSSPTGKITLEPQGLEPNAAR